MSGLKYLKNTHGDVPKKRKKENEIREDLEILVTTGNDENHNFISDWTETKNKSITIYRVTTADNILKLLIQYNVLMMQYRYILESENYF